MARTPRSSAASAGDFAAPFASSETKRSKISPAAARENVSATISCGGTPSRRSAISRSASACVLPVPADASMSRFVMA